LSSAASASKPWVVVVGGFLGAGKTSLILTAARLLGQRGLRSAIITNDQGNELVDSLYAKTRGVLSGEVTGGCFCCRFSKLMEAMDRIRLHDPDVIFAEPVGSCTDLAATVLAPLLQEFDSYRVAPFTVLVDPSRAAVLLSEDADPDAAFLFRKQLEEADLVCITKTDIYLDTPELPHAEVRYVSAMTGRGIEEWLDEILSGCLPAGVKSLDIDYERYARAEAALAWLNLSFTYEPEIPMSPASVAGPLLDHLEAAFTKAGIPVAHLKLLDTSPAGWLKAAICANGEEPVVEGDLDASPAKLHDVVLNLRATGTPARVQEIVEAEMKQFAGAIRNMRLNCFSPPPPKPERRIPAIQSQ